MILSEDKQKTVDNMKFLEKVYTITDVKDMEECVGVIFDHYGDSIRISQPLLIERIIDAVPGMRHVNPVKYPVFPSTVLTQYEAREKREKIGILDP